jgi:transporter family-2 protein
MPWWAWFGGIMGGGIILAQFFIARQIGAATFLRLFVTAGVITSLLLDHFGWVGFDQHRAGLCRILGAVLMISGVALIGFF